MIVMLLARVRLARLRGVTTKQYLVYKAFGTCFFEKTVVLLNCGSKKAEFLERLLFPGNPVCRILAGFLSNGFVDIRNLSDTADACFARDSVEAGN